MNYKKSYILKSGYMPTCVPGQEDCSLGILYFEIIELKKREQVILDTGDKEWGLIILSGHANFTPNSLEWRHVGGRRSMFDGDAASVYLPRNQKVTVNGREYVKIACCGIPMDVDTASEVIGPDRVRRVILGVKPRERGATFIISGSTNARRLTIGEAYYTSGNWAGFPPRKHDVDQMPDEGVLEKIYYFLFQPSQGFAIQKLYTEDGEIDETYTMKRDRLVEFPKDYHTIVNASGYQTHFLWLITGEHQGFFRFNDPDHDQVTAMEQMMKEG